MDSLFNAEKFTDGVNTYINIEHLKSFILNKDPSNNDLLNELDLCIVINRKLDEDRAGLHGKQYTI